MLRGNYIDLKKINTERYIYACNIFDEFQNEIRDSYTLNDFRIRHINVIEINDLNFSPVSSFTSEGHYRASFSIRGKVNDKKKLLFIVILSLFFFFRNLFSGSRAPIAKIRLRRYIDGETLVEGGEGRSEKIIQAVRFLRRDIWKPFGRLSHNVTNSRLDDWHGERDTDGYALIA